MPARRPRQPRNNITPEQREQLAELERDAKRDADAYAALVDVERCLARARKAAGKLGAAYGGTVGHIMAEHAHDVAHAIEGAEAAAEVIGGKLRVRVGHRPAGQSWESAFLWRARWNGLEESVLADWLTQRGPGASCDAAPADLVKTAEARARREQRRETLKHRMNDDYRKAAAAADKRRNRR